MAAASPGGGPRRPPDVRGRPGRPRRARGRGPRRAGPRLRAQRRRDRRAPPHRAPALPTPAPGPSARPPPTGRLVGFVYGMPNDRTHWWSTVVEPYLRRTGTDGWLDDSFVITELHVHPGFQGRGIGRALITTITDSADQPRSILSAIDTESPARGLYRALGYQDLARQVHLPQRAQPVRGDGRPAAAAPRGATRFPPAGAARLTSCRITPSEQEFTMAPGPAHVPSDGQDTARRPGGRRDAQPQAARPRRLRPPHRRRHLDLAAARQEGPGERHARRPRGDGRHRRARRCCCPRCCPRSRTRPPAAGRSTATCCSASRTARAPTTSSARRTRRSSPRSSRTSARPTRTCR